MNSETDQVKVLLVEDNLLGREIAFSMLEDLGYKSRSAENGFAALQMLENESFDLVLMDVEMPVMNGISTTKQIRLKYGNKIPVIALTAHDSPGEQEKCLAAGMNACLVKPLEEKKLRAIVAQQLECRMNVEIENKNDAHAVASGKNLVDLAYLEKITKGNEQFLLSMIDIFLEQNPEDVNMLRNAVRDADFETIRLISHKIKTSVVFIGLDKHIQSQLAEMEKLGTEAQQLGEIKKLFAEVDHVCGKADQELKIIKSERKK